MSGEMERKGRPLPDHGSGPPDGPPESAILAAHPDDVCMCGDYRKQHHKGTGRCLLEDGCKPGRCQRFRLFRPHAETQGANGQAVAILELGGRPTEVDAEIAPLVQALNDAGLETVASCSGHGKRPGNIALRDGRELIIARSFEEARRIDAILQEQPR